MINCDVYRPYYISGHDIDSGIAYEAYGDGLIYLYERS